MLENGTSSSLGQMITSTTSTTTVTAVAALGNCSLVVVAVGGGGTSFGGVDGGGSGSGYVVWKEVVLEGSLSLEVTVGEEGRSSVVRGEGGEELLEARTGELGGTYGGGNGYSGGGGYGDYSGGGGGRNGSYGEDGAADFIYGSGGFGSDVNVADIPLRDFILR